MSDKMKGIGISEEKFSDLKLPKSIRTPGRTWTKYPENIREMFKEAEDLTPVVETEGDVKVKVNQEIGEEKQKFFELVPADDNLLTYLHALNLNCMIYIKASGESEAHIKYCSEDRVSSHLVVETEKGAELTVTEETDSEEVNTSVTEVYVSENSSVEYGSIEKPGEFSYSRRKTVVNRFGRINWLNGMFTGELNRTKIETELKGDGSETEMTGVWYPTEKQHHDISLHVRHRGNNTKCDMDSRSVVDHEARSLYEGLQKVKPGAEETKSFQDQETLKLSDTSEADSSPKLMIENPDVEASHAAAAGTVEKDKEHYLETRGLDSEKAEKLVVKGFFEPVMEDIQVPRIKEGIREEVRKKLENKDDFS